MESNLEGQEKLKKLGMRVVHKFINFSFNDTPSFSLDNVHNYSMHLLTIHCLYFEMRDAIKEGDGDRVLQCWKYLLPVFRNSGRKNYTIEAFHLLLPAPLWTSRKTGRTTQMESFREHTRASWEKNTTRFASGTPEPIM